MSAPGRENSCKSRRGPWYLLAKMTFFLFLLFLQLSCGRGAGTMSSPSAVTAAVIAITPGNGSAEVSTSGTISVSFNGAMDPSTITADTFQVSGPDGPISGTVSYDDATITANFTPLVPLMPQASYTATLSTAVKGKGGSPLSGGQTWNFRTGEDVLKRPGTDIVQTTLFGQHMHHADTTTAWPAIQFGGWRLWDAGVTWNNLEPNRNDWRFTKLDRDIALAEEHHVEVVLPLGLTPAWASARPTESSAYGPGLAAEPANMADWRDYVSTVATRYKNRVHYYEIWNEPNSKAFYTGTVSQMVELAKTAYETIKAIDPAAQIVSPGPTTGNGLTWFEQYLAQGGGNYADVIGYHLYVAPSSPEAMADLASKVKAVMLNHGAAAKPLWNTESGWYINNSSNSVTGIGSFGKVLTDSEAAAYILRAYVINWASGVDRLFWYAWDNGNMGFIDTDGKTLKPSKSAFTQAYDWLGDAQVVSCGQNSEGTWVTRLVRKNGHSGWIMWNAEKTLTTTVPKEWKALTMTNVAGSVTDLANLTQLKVDYSPILLEN